MRKTAGAIAALTLVCGVGCGGDDESPSDTGVDVTQDTSTDDVTADVGTDSAADVTADDVAADAVRDTQLFDTAPPECAADFVTSVSGLVQDTDGTPVADAKSQLCVRVGSPDGNLVCLRPEDTGTDGKFEIFVPDATQCMGGGSMRVFVPESTFATTYCHIDTASEDGTLAIADPVTLFPTDAVAELPPYGDSAEARTVVFPGGFEVPEFVPALLDFNFDEAAYGRLGARRVDPTSEGLCFVEGELDGLFAFTVEADVERSFAFRFDNVDGFDAGATVNLFILGGLETHLNDGSAVPETSWVHYDNAVVSDDGEWVEGNIPAFTWLGYALAE